MTIYLSRRVSDYPNEESWDALIQVLRACPRTVSVVTIGLTVRGMLTPTVNFLNCDAFNVELASFPNLMTVIFENYVYGEFEEEEADAIRSRVRPQHFEGTLSFGRTAPIPNVYPETIVRRM